MDIRKVLVPLDGRCEPEDTANPDASALRSALKIARRLEARVEVLSVVNPPTQDTLGLLNWVPDYGTNRILEELEELDKVRQRNAQKSYEIHVVPEIGTDGLRAEFVEREGPLRATIASSGRLSDLVVLAGSTARWEQPYRPILEAVLHETARPLLVVPEEAPRTLAEHVTIGWNDSPEAARALAGAMPLLHRAKSVTVLTCRGEDEPNATASLEAVIGYLGLHGVTAETAEIVAQHHRSAQEIIDTALARGSDLLVLGSVFHSRAYSFVYGSLTEEALKAQRLSALLVQ